MEDYENIDIQNLDNWEKRNRSWITLLSYAFGSFAIEMVSNSYGSLYFFFYEDLLSLTAFYILIAQVLFAVWNAVNDPLIGYFTERQRPYWKRWGKRGLWTGTMIIPMYLAYALVFNPPAAFQNNYFLLFLWLLLMLLLADTFYSIFYVHWMGMFPEKFNTDKLKRKANVFRTYIAILGVVVGNLLPPELYDLDDPNTFGPMALIVGAIGALAGLAVIYGTRESPRRIAIECSTEIAEEKEPFSHYLKLALNTNSYKGYLWFYVGNKTWDLFIMGTLPYWFKYVLGRPSDDITLVLALFIVGQLLSVPVWTYIQKKVGFRKGMIMSGYLQAICTIPFIFLRNYTIAIPFFLIAGFGNGAMWTHLAPVLGESLDELSVKTGKRDSGVFVGINTFFGRFMIIVFTVLTLFVHWITGYVADQPVGTDTQSEPAKWGIQILLAGIPVIGLSIAIFMFSRLYDIKGEKKEWLERKKVELGL